MNRLGRLGLFVVGLAASAVALAQAYPAKPITMIVPFTAGGPTDTVGRSLALAMSKLWASRS
ncbi:MAG: hypothetical protein OHK0044_08620 [Burkholderiaceae bacterium]